MKVSVVSSDKGSAVAVAKVFIIILILSSGSNLWAAKAVSKAKPGVDSDTIILLDPQMDPKVFAKGSDGAKVYTLDQSTALNRSVVMPLPVQEQFFKQTTLINWTKKMDHFDRDQLVRYLRFRDLGAVVRKYPQISPEILKKAQALANTGIFRSLD